jgi:hypothetical protein
MSCDTFTVMSMGWVATKRMFFTSKQKSNVVTSLLNG